MVFLTLWTRNHPKRWTWILDMPKFLEVILFVAMPLAWGLMVNSFFGFLRGRTNGPEGGAA